MERAFTFQKGEYYHIYNRGVDKRKIFFSPGDWGHFQRLLFLRNDKHGNIRPARAQSRSLSEIKREETLVDICAYAMMKNHFHLLVREKGVGGISKFMSKFLTSFAKYMNQKYERSGPLMCRPFRAREVDSDRYMRWLLSYIHLNPLEQIEPTWEEKGIKDVTTAQKFLSEYPYSSYYDYYIGDRDESYILAKGSLPIDVMELENIDAMVATCANISR